MTHTIEWSGPRASVRLESGGALSLVDAAGVALTALTGRAWVTMEGDIRDIDLTPGVTYRIERDGLTLVNALEPSLVEVRVQDGKRALWRERFEGIWRWLARAGRARARARMARSFGRFQP
jgi:hypothetical protein